MFLGALFAGHIYIIIIITAVQIVSFKEVISIIDVPSRARSLRFTKALNWYFLGVAMYFLYGESVLYYFKHIVLVDRILLPFATHHRFISFVLYIFGEHFRNPPNTLWDCVDNCQASFSSSARFRKDTIASNSRSLLGHIWHCF